VEDIFGKSIYRIGEEKTNLSEEFPGYKGEARAFACMHATLAHFSSHLVEKINIANF